MLGRSKLAGLFFLVGGIALACSSSKDGGGSTDTPTTTDDGGSGTVDSGPAPVACVRGTECTSKVCTSAGICAEPSPTDGVQNADETDIDCGGATAPKCDTAKTCAAAGDCVSGVCTDDGTGVLKCQAASSTDGVKNQDETDIDCGGTKAPKCAAGGACTKRDDCATDVCTAGKCVQPVCDDNAKNGTESDIDCGGPACPRCADLESCATADDCTSGVCTGGKCQVPTTTDLVKNGVETDVDCGGAGNPKCAVAKACKVHGDCVNDACNYDSKCVARRSCTGHYGGDTCGAGGQGGQGAATYETCCATAPAGAGGAALGKYKITSGRMREFLTRINGDVRKAVRDLRTAGKIPAIPTDAAHLVLPPEWDLYLPTSLQGCDKLGTCGQHDNGAGGKDAELTDRFFSDNTDINGIYSSAWRHVGGSLWQGQTQTLQGCSVKSPGTHAYWMDATTQSNYFGDIAAEFDQTVYDTKFLNCVDYFMLQAFCVWDGGRLETTAEWTAAIGPNNYPWGNTPSIKGPGSATFYAHRYPESNDAKELADGHLSAGQSIEYADFLYSYEYPRQNMKDYIVFLAAPGRLPKGYGPWGHADLAGIGFEMTSNTTFSAIPKSGKTQWVQPASFEGHGYSKTSYRNVDSIVDKYGKTGGRCVYLD